MFSSLYRAFTRMPFYAVARGRSVGIFHTWPECEAQVKGFAGAAYKKFPTQDEANHFIAQKRSNATLSAVSTGLAKRANTYSKRPASAIGSGSGQAAKRSKIDESKTTDYTSNIKQTKKYGKYEFMEDDEGYVHVYTDGSCENNGRRNAIAGYGVYFGEQHPLNTAAPVEGPATNNRGEIQGATRAIILAADSGIKRLCINTDSHFVIRSVTEWMANWKKRNWQLSSGGPVKNEQDFRNLDRAIEENPQMKILWKYVPAHIGICGNERADELARKGALAYKK